MLEDKDDTDLETLILDDGVEAYGLELIEIAAKNTLEGTELKARTQRDVAKLAAQVALSMRILRRGRQDKLQDTSMQEVLKTLTRAHRRDLTALRTARAYIPQAIEQARQSTALRISYLVSQNVAHTTEVAVEDYKRILTSAVGEFTSAKTPRELTRIINSTIRDLSNTGRFSVVYKSGVNIDAAAALRRHLVTQLTQTGADMTIRLLEANDHDLVRASAHFGARPTHEAWQGGVYSISGKTEGYLTLQEACDYGSVTGLCGANCRHTFSPYYTGMQPIEIPKTINGHSSEEFYTARQKINELKRQDKELKRKQTALQAAKLDTSQVKAERQRISANKNKISREYGIGISFDQLNVEY